MTIRTSISKRDRKRTLTCGAVILQPRYVLNFNDPRTGKRRQLFFRSQREAIARRDSILAAIATNSYSESRSQMTVGGAVEHWLENRRTEVKASTWKTYRQISTNCIIGPLLVGTPGERKTYREEGSKPDGTYFVEALGAIKVCDLTTGDIRRWHRTLLAEVGSRSANMSKTLLRAALSLAAEDFSVRPPPMPTKLGRGRGKPKRTLLTPAQVGVLLKAAREDRERGIYYAWPFLTGTRPSEQLGVLWEDIDLEKGVVVDPPHAGAQRRAIRDDEDGLGSARDPAGPDAARDAGGLALDLSAPQSGIAPRLSRADGWLPDLLELARAILPTGADTARTARRHAPQRAPRLHLGVAGERRGGRSRRQARRPRQRRDHAQSTTRRPSGRATRRSHPLRRAT